MLSFGFQLTSHLVSPCGDQIKTTKLAKLYCTSNISSPKSCAKISNNLSNISTSTIMTNREILLSNGLKKERMPNHVAVLMDGHVKWAKRNRVLVEDGYEMGMEKIKAIARLCLHFGIKVLSVFLAGTWTHNDVEFLMEMFEDPSLADIKERQKLNVKTSIIGDTYMQGTVELIEDVKKSNIRLHVIGAVNYSGRYDITQACKNIAQKVKAGQLQPDDISESIFEQELETKCTKFPSPDLFIRTNGEYKMGNCMLWQMPYTELIFVDKVFPDFEEEDFIEALVSFQKRDRRFVADKKNIV